MPPRRTFGSTWWGEQWIAALEALGSTWANRLPRGRSYARKGAVTALLVSTGGASARVSGSRPAPYRVRLRLAALTDRQWDGVVGALAGEVRYAAQLLAGEMPADVDVAFRAAGVTLFPLRASELETECSCPDWANPCKHVAAVHYVLGEAFDRDPFLLFEIRGRTRDALLDALRRARSGAANADAGACDPRGADQAATMVLAVDSPAAFYAARGPLDELHFRPAPPDAPLALLRRLGTPPSWRDSASPVQLLGDVYAAASREALRRALGDAPANETARPLTTDRALAVARPSRAVVRASPPAAQQKRTTRKKSSEPPVKASPAGRVLALLEARGPLGIRDIERSLRRGPRGAALRTLLASLREDGFVTVVGRTRAARYRVSQKRR
jgi:uncharacterized Zn finger protein